MRFGFFRSRSGDRLPVPGWTGYSESTRITSCFRVDLGVFAGGLEARGARYLSADAQSSSEKQISDIEGLMARGAEVLIVLAHDADAIAPAMAMARAEGVPILAYDRLIDSPGVFYLSFDNREVGRIQAREIQKRRPEGRFIRRSADMVRPASLPLLCLIVSATGLLGATSTLGWQNGPAGNAATNEPWVRALRRNRFSRAGRPEHALRRLT